MPLNPADIPHSQVPAAAESSGPGRTCAVVNWSGGGGKTACNIGACVAEYGYRVPIVDGDAQCDASVAHRSQDAVLVDRDAVTSGAAGEVGPVWRRARRYRA
ncbi:AAA family ATPase [Streptomyces sioyaensis]|uniref:ParA family protein n=1 Tax=Streptomyces sioyaensis TaxID=67364 RepID=UPI0034114F85